MKLGCPICGSKFTLSQAVHEAAMKEMIELAARFGKNWNLVYDYTECFRPSQWGSVGEAKRMRILQDVDKLFARAEFDYDGKRYRTDWVRVIAAMRAVVDAEKYGFKNHNYLKKVLLGEKPERLSAEGLTAKEEAARETLRRSEVREQKSVPSPCTPSEGGQKEVTAAEFKAMKGIESLADQVGRKI